MNLRNIVPWLAVGQLLGLCTVLAATPQPSADNSPDSPADALLASLDSQSLRALGREVLERNPGIARAEQLAAAAAARAPQVRALPDPVAALQLFVLPPETRVGPQLLNASIAQKLPWFGKLDLREQAMLYEAAAAQAEVETIRLDMLTEARRLAYELAFVTEQEAIVETQRLSLVRFERAAQTRYRGGNGLQQESVRIQAQITRADVALLEFTERRAALLAALNALRDRAADASVEGFELPPPREVTVDRESWVLAAAKLRPEIRALDAKVAAGGTRVELAEKDFRPDVTLGLSYTVVERRDDSAGRANPPAGNGDDILGLTASVNLPVWRGKLDAAVEEAEALRWATEEEKRQVLARIESSIGDLTARIPLLVQHLALLDSVLLKQATQGLRSAETAYTTGKLNAVDLLDADLVLFEVHIAAARTRADLAIAWAQLERAVGRPLGPLSAANSRTEQPLELTPSEANR